MFPIKDILDDPKPVVRICDVGAMVHELGTEPHHSLITQGLAHVVGFEPNDNERRKARELLGPDHVILPYFIGDGCRGQFRIGRFPMTSSLYEPNMALLEKFSDLAAFHEVKEVREVSTHRLDDVAELGAVDYLKMDVQGAELDVIGGAGRTLSEAVVVQTEVELIPLYKDQPLFADIDRALRAHGFQFHRFLQLTGKIFKPLAFKDSTKSSLGQQLWSDAIYVKDFMAFDKLAPERLLALAIVMHEAYRSYGLVHLALEARDRQIGGTLAAAYLELLLA